jgi:hypothetical protein
VAALGAEISGVFALALTISGSAATKGFTRVTL